MAGRRTKEAPLIPSNSLIASAVRYQGKTQARIYQTGGEWQSEAWRHYDICGELRYACQWISNACSRVMLFPGVVDELRQVVRTTDSNIQAALDALFNGPQAQSQILGALALHVTVAGEAYLVGRTVLDEESGESSEVWEVIGKTEIRVAGNRWSINYGNGTKNVELADDDVVIRIWRPHPNRRMEADSPVRAMLPILTEIEYFTRHIYAQTTSRLAGAGMLAIPQSIQFPPPPPGPDGEPTETANTADAFMQTLAEAMMAPLTDSGTAAAHVPLIITVPDEAVDKIKLIQFWTQLDSAAVDNRKEAIRRLALGMDIPPEIMLGMTSGASASGGTGHGASHWSAWQIDESAIKVHVEPILELICNGIALQYLRPASENPLAAIGIDTQNLHLRPDRSRESLELFDRGELAAVSLRRENGFSEDDAPDDNEKHEWLIRRIAGGSATPEQIQAALEILGVVLPIEAPVGPPTETRPPPSLLDHPAPRSAPQPNAAALMAASEALVFRALERAGNRLRNSGAKPPNVPAFETHVFIKANGSTDYLLDDAWPCAAKVLEGIADVEAVVPVLDSYCRSLLAQQQPHTREALAKFLSLVKS